MEVLSLHGQEAGNTTNFYDRQGRNPLKAQLSSGILQGMRTFLVFFFFHLTTDFHILVFLIPIGL